jgi:hypothetical protein
MKSLNGFLLAGLLAAMAPMAWAEDAVGKWAGPVKAPAADIPVVVTIAKAADGKLSASLESPTQAPGQTIPVDTITSDGATMTFSIAMILGDYKATWDETQKMWTGAWTQNGTTMKLDLTRAP